jgi:hypothetical protein
MPNLLPRWEETRKMGRNRFIQLYGVVMFVFIMLSASMLISYFVLDRPITLGIFVGSFIVFTIIGYFFGWMWWEIGEKKAGFKQDKEETE